MEEQLSTAEERASQSQALTPPDAQSMEGMQQVNPDGSVANTAVQPSPSVAPRKPRGRCIVAFNIWMKKCMKSFMIGARKLWILLWKNFLLRRRSWILLIWQILMLGVVTGLSIVIGPPTGGRLIDPTDPSNVTQDGMIRTFADAFKGTILIVGTDPQISGITAIMDTVIIAQLSTPAQPSPLSPITWEPVTKTELEQRPVEDERPYQTERLFPKEMEAGPIKYGKDEYYEAGILGLQILIDDAAMKVLHQGGREGLKRKITLKTFPYPPFRYGLEHAVKGLVIFFCCLFILVLTFSNPFLTKNVGSEKETGVKELMKLCGYPGWMQWFAWYLIMFLVDLILLVFMLLLLKTIPCGYDDPPVPVLNHGDFFLCLFLLQLSMISNNAFILFCCSLFKSTSVGTAIGILVPLPPIIAMAFVNLDSASVTLAVALLPHACFVHACKFIFAFEGIGRGVQWSLLAEDMPNIPNLNLGLIILMFLVDIVLYQSLAVYFEAILPSEYGVRKPAYYPIQALIAPIMARMKKGKTAPMLMQSEITVPPTESKAHGFEPPPGQEKMIGVAVQNLVKKFDGNKTAVNGVSVKLYDGEIFALLGHNGAGKTTLISVLTGLFAPTSGTAMVGGYDIRTDMDKVRQSLGLCPQHDMLFSNLTVMEHLRIFGQMKGQRSSQVKQEALGLLNMMNLTEKKNTISKKLSGGQKRKLCLGMALIGQAKVVILDEPTSGMDPEARRAIWDILLQIRGQRTILLTTHFMEEADVLGDRIGIMAEGKLQCCGSPSFLKSFYGTGYTLKIALLPDANKDTILSSVQKHIPDASLKPINMPNEIFISLPTEAASPSALSSLFSTLTDKKEEMRIESLGLSVASMDEIFVKVGELSDKAATERKEDVGHPTKSTTSKASARTEKDTHGYDKPQEHIESSPIREAPSVAPVEGQQPQALESVKSQITPSAAPSKTTHRKARFGRLGSLFRAFLFQWLALIIKRFICTKRKIGFLLFQIFVPAIMMFGAVMVINDKIDPGPLPPPLKIGLSEYKNPQALYSEDVQGRIPKFAQAISPPPRAVPSVQAELEKVGKSDITFFRENLIVGGEVVSDTEYTAWFNTIPLHAAPLAINLASNIRGTELDPIFKVEMTNHPLKTREALMLKVAVNLADKEGFTIGWIFGGFMWGALLLFATFFVVLPTEERLNQSRQLQLMTGVHPLTYWTAYFLWDFVLLLFVTIIVIAVGGCFQKYTLLSSHGGLGVIFIIMLAFGCAIIPLAYFISNIPKSVAGAVIIFLIFLVFPFIITFVFMSMPFDPELFDAGMIMVKFVSMAGLLLSYVLTGITIARNGRCNLLGDNELDIICTSSASGSSSSEFRNLLGCCGNCKVMSGVTCFEPDAFLIWEYKAFGTTRRLAPGIGQIVMWFFITSLICLVLHIILELGILRFILSLLTRCVKRSDFLEQVDDQDVREEEQRVAGMIMTKNTSSDALVVDTLCKNFGGLSAVSKLTFAVHHGECFGLLGTNGAGKTTSFRMITGEELPSFGDVHESRFTLKRNRRTLISHIGYCPQFDAFIPYLTGKENLQLFARLRGIPWRHVNVEAARLLENVGLTGSGNVQCRRYSGGMKRRLSAAIALIGNPPLILLDEPTSGVDPVSRRQFWKVLESAKGAGQSIILTSHSMDECEALCARLGIMVNGQLQCIGGVQHLKHKFAQGYSLTLRLKAVTDPQMQQYAMGMLGALNNEISAKFHPCMLKDQHETVLQYQIENTSLGWNVIYNNLEELKKSYKDIIEDYSVSETSLEEVFLAFSRKQYPPRDSKMPLWRRIFTCQC